MRAQPVLTCFASATLVLIAACSAPPTTTSSPEAERIAAAEAARRDEEQRRQQRADAAAHESQAQAAPSEPVAEAEADAMADALAAAGGQGAVASQAGRAEAKLARQALVAPPAYVAGPPPAAPCCIAPSGADTEKYAHLAENPVQRAAEVPVSTFSIDVDTGSYSNVRRFLAEGRLPPQDAVRVEELINYFDYAYAPPRERGTPFAVETEIAPTPWNAKTHLLRIGIQGWKPQGPRVASNLVFLVDVSGSMQDANKLPLVKQSLRLLARELSAADRVSLVVYAGASGAVLEPTPGNQTERIEQALERLEAGGSTNGADGIRLAYRLAEQAFVPGANNRVLLATDGDFNVGITDFEQLVDLVEEKRRSGVALTTLGFGGGNYNDHLMERLADAGNGNHAYIDTLAEARKVLVEQRDATLQTIARDVKIQVEFNPAVVAEYRLVGYENRLLRREDFNNDRIDAGEIGAGHSVTALYEVALVGSGGERVDGLRYGASAAPAASRAAELAFLRLRYKKPEDGMDASSRLIERPIRRGDVRDSLAQASTAFRFAAAVAGFGQLLRGGAWTGEFQYTEVERLARESLGSDRHGYAAGFLQLVQQARALSTQQARASITED